MIAVEAAPARASVSREIRKLPAFLRRDLLITLSYRTALVTDWLNLATQVLLFSFVSRLVRPTALPTFGGHHISYLAFVSVGIAVTGFMAVGVGRLVTSVRSEQMMGTLESLMVTPTAPSTILLGSVAYDLVYVPIRTLVFLVAVSLSLGVDFRAAGIPPALLILAFFIPFVWGLGAATAASVLTFRRGSGVVGFGVFGLTLTSGSYFPLGLLPHWLEVAARLNPVAIALDGMRGVLAGSDGWAATGTDLAKLAPLSLGFLVVGIVAFRLAMRRERRLGTLGLY
jgi:ABC-2 type transport system permease protein